MSNDNKSNVVIIGTNEYPAMAEGKVAADFLAAMKASETAQRGRQVIELRKDVITDAVRGYILALEKAALKFDTQAVYEQAHEIRGLAATVGLEASGRIADGLCKYIDTASRLGVTIDPAVINLHVGAINRAANAKDDATRLGRQVAAELSALVTHKLAR
jgi:methylmalonyl-CoA mutase N-terminal domain/subunit